MHALHKFHLVVLDEIRRVRILWRGLLEKAYLGVVIALAVVVGLDEIAVLVAAYGAILKRLHLVERDDPITQMIAKKIIELGERGVSDPDQLVALAISEMGL